MRIHQSKPLFETMIFWDGEFLLFKNSKKLGKIFTTVNYVFFGAKVSHLLKSKNSNSNFKKKGEIRFPMGQITDYSNQFYYKRTTHVYGHTSRLEIG
jgi:hypothetical protein